MKTKQVRNFWFRQTFSRPYLPLKGKATTSLFMTTLFFFAVYIEVLSFRNCWNPVALLAHSKTIFTILHIIFHNETTIHHIMKKLLPFTINCTISNTSTAANLFGTNLKMKTWLSTARIGFRVNLTWPFDCWFQLPKRRPLYWDTLGVRRPFIPRTSIVTFRSFISISFVPHSTLRKSPV